MEFSWYKAILMRLRVGKALGTKNLLLKSDSNLVASHRTDKGRV